MKCQSIALFSLCSQELPRERRGHGGRDRLRGVPVGHVPFQAAVAAHDRGAARARQEGEAEMCVSLRKKEIKDHMLVVTLRPDSQCFFVLSAVLFNMHDTDNDGTITLEEYRHVSLSCFLKDAPSKIHLPSI